MLKHNPTGYELFAAADGSREVMSRQAEIVSTVINFLEHRVHEVSFECACDVLSNIPSKGGPSNGGPCCACTLRRALEAAGSRYMTPTIERWLARDHKAIRGERDGRHA